SVEVGDDLGLYLNAALRQADNAALHAAAHGAGHLVCRRFGVCSGKRPVGEDSFRGFDLMDEIGKSFYIVKRDDGSVLLILRRGGQRASDTKERPLNLLGPGADLLLRRARRPSVRSVRCLHEWLRCSCSLFLSSWCFAFSCDLSCGGTR